MSAGAETRIWVSKLYCERQTLSQYQSKTRSYIEYLRSTHPIFNQLTAVGRQQAKPVPGDLNYLESIVAELCPEGGHPDDYVHKEEDGRIGPDTLCRIGFSLSYLAYMPIKNGHVEPGSEPYTIELSLRGCSHSAESTSNAVLKCHPLSPEEFRSPKMLRTLLGQTLHLWGGAVGGVTLTDYERAVRNNERASYAGQWLFYLPLPTLGRCLPPDIRWEPFHNGILIETTPHLPDATNPADLAAGHRVRDVLDEFGLVSHATYAIEGWPPDAEERRYEEFISGAPAGRKYVVHCVPFDGYDPDRKVLLYAKLFRPLRRQPREWGLRGWDGPVLNEAKRQVRAAAKAGGVPIEWHIGLEEPAHRVRQLIVDFSNITEKQLKVQYTPLEQALE